jgi:hypothetical protein
MRWFEIKEMDKDPQQVQPNYAELADLKTMVGLLQKAEPDGRFDQQNASGVKAVRHIRAFGISVADLKNAIKSIGGVEKSPDIKQSTVSSSFPVYSFEKDKVLYTIVIGMKGLNKDDAESRGIGRKELSPAGLGLVAGMYSKSDLITKTKAAVEKKYRNKDPILADTLIGLVDNAVQGGKNSLPAEQMDHVAPYIGTLSQDFGEILAPILMMDDSDTCELPSGNEALVDVRIPGKGNISVKALTGSGTSFRAVAKYMDEFEKSMETETDQEKKKRFAILNQFNPKTGGKNVDKIIRAVSQAQTEEYKALKNIIGTDVKSYQDLVDAVETKTGKADYGTFLNTFYPMMTAGPWGKPVGLPADGKYYMNPEGDSPKPKQAGKPSYDSNPAKGGADIITYSLGIGLMNYIRQGDDADSYKDMMTDIVNKADAVIGHITIQSDGKLSLKTQPFSDLKFNFQYHAPSHLPGNNLPGFMAIL